VCTTKLGRQEKRLLAFDAIALAAALGRNVTAGKIIHGENHDTVNVKWAR